MNRIRIGTRCSRLALAQTGLVVEELRNLCLETELVPIRTAGDLSSQPLVELGGKGAFTSRIQDALLANQIDLAVHSLKDLPAVEFPGLRIAAIPKRENPGDALVFPVSMATQPRRIDDLPQYARIGTGSVRRKAQLLRLRNDLAVHDIRGNVETRLEQLDGGEFDALVLASAGLIRLGLKHRISFPFSSSDFAPAVGQGALALEIRDDDHELCRMVQPVNHDDSRQCVFAERAMLRRLRAGCHAPVGAVSHVTGGELTLQGVVLSLDGQHRIAAEFSGCITDSGLDDDAIEVGFQVAELLLERGAGPFLDR